ncbi:MAG: DUF1974 domain-containing protein, partial [Pseudomonadota bacterium]
SPVSGPTARWYRRINRLTSAFTITADITLLILGGKFKFAEKLSGRFADALSHLYIASATLKRYEDDGRPAEDLPLLNWALADSLHRVETSLHGVLDNFPSRSIGVLLRLACFPFGRRNRPVDDHTTRQVAKLLMSDNTTRKRLTHDVFLSSHDDGAGTVLKAFAAVLAASEAERAVVNGLKRQPSPVNVEKLSAEAVEAGILTPEQADLLIEAQRLSAEVIAVDEFTPDELSTLLSQDEPVSEPPKAVNA